MRIAIFSDVHGNADALTAVLSDIKRQGSFDKLLFAGDLIFGGHRPAECMQLIQDNDVDCVYGNTDEFFWLEQTRDEGTSDEEWQIECDYFAWVKDAIGDDGLSFLTRMPFEQVISPTDDAADNLLVVHANPKDVQGVIFPAPEIQEAKAGRVIQTDEDLKLMLEGVSTNTIAFGHIHMPNIRTLDNYTLINVSSVSIPQDGDWRSKHAILTFTDGTWSAEHHYVEYDAASTQQALFNSKMPLAEKFAKLLRLP